MTDRLHDIEARLQAADGKYKIVSESEGCYEIHASPQFIAVIANAPADIQFLLDEGKQLREELCQSKLRESNLQTWLNRDLFAAQRQTIAAEDDVRRLRDALDPGWRPASEPPAGKQREVLATDGRQRGCFYSNQLPETVPHWRELPPLPELPPHA